MASAPAPDRSPAVAIWLFATAAIVFGLVVVGGATRLTGSGLSITQWKPIMGALPPMGDAAWADAFHRYQATTQYQYINRGMSLDAFKGIFWWEWSHRLLGRLVGVVFFAPMLVFLALRRIPRRLIVRCFILFALGGLQGLVGWWMVKSGLEGRVTVAPERLATHLGLALILYSALIWTGLEAWAGAPKPFRVTRWASVTGLLAGLVYLQCLLGALVAGNQAGLVDNDWPLMNGRVFPEDYWGGGLWRTLLHSQAAVQFNHRLIAYLITVVVIVLVVAAARARALPRQVRGLTFVVAALVAAQVGLGITTLMAHAPLPLSQSHQALAAIVLAATMSLAWRARRP